MKRTRFSEEQLNVPKRETACPNQKTAPGSRPGAVSKWVPPSRYSPTKEIRSTIAEVRLNFRVRNGNGCGPHSRDGGKNVLFMLPSLKRTTNRKTSFRERRSR